MESIRLFAFMLFSVPGYALASGTFTANWISVDFATENGYRVIARSQLEMDGSHRALNISVVKDGQILKVCERITNKLTHPDLSTLNLVFSFGFNTEGERSSVKQVQLRSRLDSSNDDDYLVQISFDLDTGNQEAVVWDDKEKMKKLVSTMHCE